MDKAKIQKLAIIPIMILIVGIVVISSLDLGKKYKELTDSRPEINILFIGNSYTRVNDMPKILEEISISQSSAPYKVHTEQVVVDGANLKQLWEGQAAVQKIKEGKWQYVVLQEQSATPLYPSESAISYTYGKYFNDTITQAGAKTVFYATWPRQKGNEIYKQFSQGYAYMGNTVNNHYYTMAHDFGAAVVYTSDAWEAAKQLGIPMYAEDGSHPSMYGSYFVALKFYHYLLPDVKLDTENLYIPSGVDKTKVKPMLDALQW